MDREDRLPLLVCRNWRANRDFERTIDRMVTAAALYYHKEIDYFLGSSCAMTSMRLDQSNN